MRLYKILWVFLLIFSCKETARDTFNATIEKSKINQNIDNWHLAAAKADYDTYFGLMTQDGIFIGTDATENWNNTEFRAFSKPYFDKGKAWNFTSLERHVYFSSNNKTAWFDELLQTQMGVCRGSGVMEIEGNSWKIAHYVLSLTIPNDMVKEVVDKKSDVDSLLIDKLKSNHLGF